MAKFIKLTLPNGQARHVNVDRVDFIDPAEGKDVAAYLGVVPYDECGFPVRETPEQILKLIERIV